MHSLADPGCVGSVAFSTQASKLARASGDAALAHLAAAQELVGLGHLGAGLDEPSELGARRGEVAPGVLHQAQVLVAEAELGVGA